jgi:hypothetical protein
MMHSLLNVRIVALVAVLLTASIIGCTQKPEATPEQPRVDATVKKGTESITGKPPGTVWNTLAGSQQKIVFTYPANVPPPFDTIDLSAYHVQFMTVYPATVSINGNDTVLPANTPIVIMNVQRATSSTQPVNNYVGIGRSSDPILLSTGQFLIEKDSNDKGKVKR